MSRLTFVAVSMLTLASCVSQDTTAASPGHPGWSTTSNGCRVWNPNPVQNETVVWSGDCADGLAEGRGKLIWYSPTAQPPAGTDQRAGSLLPREQILEEGDRYDGQMKNGKLNGLGVGTSKTGNWFRGIWENGLLNGHGSETLADGTRYEGDWVDGRPEGFGILTFQNRVRKGTWKNGCLVHEVEPAESKGVEPACL